MLFFLFFRKGLGNIFFTTFCVFFYFLEKGLGIVSLPHFMYDSSRKLVLMPYSIN